MPVVRKQRPGQVDLAPIPSARKTAAETAISTGAGLAEAKGRAKASVMQAVDENIGRPLERIGLTLYGELQERARDQADQTAILEASNKLAAWRNETLYNPNGGAFTKRGKDALPLPEEVRTSFEKAAGEIGAGLHTDRQRAAWARMQSQEWQTTDLQVRRHVFSEMQNYREGELKGAIANATDEAIRSAADPLLVRANLDKAVSAIQTNGPSFGLGPDAIAQQVRGVTSDVHRGVIAQLLAQEQESKAADYFKAVKGEIAADKIDEVERALEEGTIRGQSQQKADAIIAAGGTLTQQLEKTKDLEPKLRDAVRERIEHNAIVKDRADREVEETNLRTAFDILDKGGTVDKIPPVLWASFDGAKRASLRSYQMTLAKGTPVVTDPATYYRLVDTAGTDPQAFAQSNLLAYRAYLDDGDWQHVVELQRSIRAGDRNKAEKDLAGFRTKKELLDDTLAQYGIDPKPKAGTPEDAALGQLRRMLDRRVDAAQADGKKVTNQELQQTIDGLLSAETTVQGSWWNIWPGGKPFFDEKKRLVDTTIDDIPAQERTTIESVLRDRGRPVTDATVLDLWLETQIRRKR